MIPEGAVLLTVQYLQQCRCGVSPHIVAQLIDLIQHQQWIHGAAADKALHNAAGHSAYVGLAMAADVRFIPHAAQTDTAELAVHCLCHGDRNRRLAYARRPHKTNDFALGAGMDLPHGNMLQNALFHLVKPVVVPVQYGTGLIHVGTVLGFPAPGHFQAGVQIIADH